MAKRRTPIKLTPGSIIATCILSWATYLCVIEIVTDYHH